MAKDPRFIDFQTLRAGKNGNGSIITVKLSNTGDILMEMTVQNGVINKDGKNLPKFDHDNKLISGFSDIECAKVVRMIEKQFMSVSGFEAELKFPHHQSREPKNIEFKFSSYNNVPQMQVKMSAVNEQGRYVSIYLNEDEMEVIKEFFKASYSPVLRKQFADECTENDFRNYLASQFGGN